jgi:colanic acid/amylovoran biosynthesis glycosyltransferase
VGPVRAVTIGRLTEKKGIDCGLRAIARVIASGRAVSYTIVGEGPQRGDLERLAQELGIEQSVAFAGWISHDDVVRVMEDSHILIAPSVIASDGDEEGIPNVIKEAMATGMPVISTRHGGIPELLEDNVSGLLVPERDDEALANRIGFLIDHPAAWALIGREARRRIEADFDIDKLNNELVSLYEQVTRKCERLESPGERATFLTSRKP